MSAGASIEAKPVLRHTISSVMGLVLLALLPGIAIQCAAYGVGVLARLGFAIVLALLLEVIALRLRGRPARRLLADLSAPVAAILLTLMLPSTSSFLALSLGIAVALLLGKHLFGGLGENVFNPAMLGCAAVTLWHSSPVLALPAQAAPAWASTNWMAAAFALGGIVLVARRVISWHAPIAMLTAFVIAQAAIVPGDDVSAPLLPWQLVLAAFFIVTDPVTGCATARGRLVFASLAGATTAVAGGVAALPFVVLAANGFAPWLDALFARTRTRPADAR